MPILVIEENCKMSEDEFDPRSQKDYQQYLKNSNGQKYSQFSKHSQTSVKKPKKKSKSLTFASSQKKAVLKFAGKEQLTKSLFNRFNEKIFDNKLTQNTCFEWVDELPCNRAGFCKNQPGRSKIFLSSKVIDSAEKLKNTLIHELCHAASWLINKKSDGHGPSWLGWARKAMFVFPELTPIKNYQWLQIGTKYSYKCLNTSCGHCIQSEDLFDTRTLNCKFCGSIIKLELDDNH